MFLAAFAGSSPGQSSSIAWSRVRTGRTASALSSWRTRARRSSGASTGTPSRASRIGPMTAIWVRCAGGAGRAEELRGSLCKEPQGRACRLAELPVDNRPERVGQPAGELGPVGVTRGRKTSGQFDRPRQRQEAQGVCRGQLPGSGQVARSRLNQGTGGRPRREVRGAKGDAVPVRAQPIAQDVTKGQEPAQVPFGKPVLDGPPGHVVSVGLPRRRLRAARYRNRRLGGAGQDGVAGVVAVSGVSAGKRRKPGFFSA